VLRNAHPTSQKIHLLYKEYDQATLFMGAHKAQKCKFDILLSVYHYVGPQLATSQQLKVQETHTKNC
jgi:hypothetical protein